jgi:hypothetical protein
MKAIYLKIAYISYGAHMTNLLVEDIAKGPAFSTYLELIKDINKWWNSSSILSSHL